MQEQKRHPQDAAWWGAYDTCRGSGLDDAEAAWQADVLTYGRVVNNPKPKTAPSADEVNK